MAKEKDKLTNNFGTTVSDDQNSLTAGAPGPVLMRTFTCLRSWLISTGSVFRNA